jgi:hypothetical protein
MQNVEDGKVIPRQEPKEVAVAAKPAPGVARGNAAGGAARAAVDESSASLRAAQWKCEWLELRLKWAPLLLCAICCLKQSP